MKVVSTPPAIIVHCNDCSVAVLCDFLECFKCEIDSRVGILNGPVLTHLSTPDQWWIQAKIWQGLYAPILGVVGVVGVVSMKVGFMR